jgi:crotonobetainyl-CoA:carnitine CoA-transferase CaiB-like acyl-CoA transferase
VGCPGGNAFNDMDDSKEDRTRFNQLLRDADVFFANRRPGFLRRHDLDADALCEQKPGLIHATVVLHGEKGPWSERAGFDEIGAAVTTAGSTDEHTSRSTAGRHLR